jgi:hypothetical protein
MPLKSLREILSCVRPYHEHGGQLGLRSGNVLFVPFFD